MTVAPFPPRSPAPPSQRRSESRAAGARARPSARRRWASRVPLLVVLALVAVVYSTNLAGWPRYENDDEGTYYAQAWAVATQHALAHYTYWYDHPPVAWLQLAALDTPLSWVTGGPFAETAGRAAMAVVVVVSAALVDKIARNTGLPRPLAPVAALLWALSPLSLWLGRQIFLDGIALVWLLASMAAATSRPRLQAHIFSGLAFGIAVLCKETSVLAGPGILAALWLCSWRRTRSFSLLGWAMAAALVVSGYLLLATVKGELLPGPGHVSLISSIDWQLHTRKSSGAILTAGTDANDKLALWLSHDRYLLGAGLVLAPVGLLVRSARPMALVVVVYALTALRPGYLPGMYVETVLPFAALVFARCTWSLWQVLGRLSSRRPLGGGRRLPAAAVRAPLAVAVVLALAAVAAPWSAGWRTAMTADDNVPYEESLDYVSAHLPRTSVLLTDDNSWNELVARGWSGDRWDGPIWYFKLDSDPEARQHLPHGWRDVDYVLVGRSFGVILDSISDSWGQLPEVISALHDSTVVASWGPAGSEVWLLRVRPERSQGCQAWTCPRQEPQWSTPPDSLYSESSTPRRP